MAALNPACISFEDSPRYGNLSVSGKKHDARGIANFLLDYADSKNVPVTNLALLKIIYFAHGWHLKMFRMPLVKNTFEAWQHGPVIRVVYDAFKSHSSDPVTSRATKFDPEKNDYVTATAEVSESLADFLRNIFDIYGAIDPFELSDMTHVAGGPWDTIMKKSRDNICLQLKIPDELIAEHFVQSNTWTM